MASLDIKTAFDEAKPKHVAKIMHDHNTHAWIMAALFREMSKLTGKTTFECVESSFVFNRCLRQTEAWKPRACGRKWQPRSWANVEEEWMKERKGVLLAVEGESGGVHQICSFMWADNFWIISHSEKHLEQMLKDFIEEAAKVDLEPKPASPWWTSTYASEERGGHDSGNFERLLQILF